MSTSRLRIRGRFDPGSQGRWSGHHPYVYREHLAFHSIRMATREWMRKTRACQEYDPYGSFVPGQPGAEEERLWSTDGRFRGDYETWILGKKAYEILVRRLDKYPDNRELCDLLDQCRKVDADNSSSLRKLLEEGSVKLSITESPEEAVEEFDQSGRIPGGFVWRLQLLFAVWQHAVDACDAPDSEIDWEAVAAISCLFKLDDVVIAGVLDGNGVVDAYVDAREFLDQIEQSRPSSVNSDRLARDVRRATARMAASKRHEPSRRVRDRAIALYEAGHWKSRRDAVRQILPELESEAAEAGYRPSKDRFSQTVYEWLTAFDKGRT